MTRFETLIFLVAGVAFIASDAGAQNLVANGGFEQNTAIPFQVMQWDLPVGWDNVNLIPGPTNAGSPDYFYVGAPGTQISLPSSNVFATVMPHSGNGIMGFAAYNAAGFGVYREYISTALTAPLTVGQTYSLTFYITNGANPTEGWGCNHVGAALSTGPLTQVYDEPIAYTAQCDNPNVVFDSTWVLQSCTFTATAAWDRITFGNFHDDANTQVAEFIPGTIHNAYYFIDDIVLVPVDSTAFVVSADTAICLGDSVSLVASGDSSVWWSTFADQTTSIGNDTVLTVGPQVTTTYLAHGVDTTLSVTVTVNTPPNVDLGNDTSLCAGTSLVLDAGNAGAAFQWSTGATTQTVSVDSTGTYTVTVTNGCTAVDTVLLTFSNGLIVDLGDDQTVCLGDTVVLNAGSGGTSYAWSTGDTTASILATASGVYAVSVSNGACSGADTITITTVPPAPVALGNDTLICLGSTLTLDAGNPGYNFLWSTGETTQTITIGQTPQTVWVQVSLGSCSASDTVSITDSVCRNDGLMCLFVPNAFSPNGDGTNDAFKVIHCAIADYNLSIYNRWGQKVFATTDANAGWDGTWRSALQPVGVYVYYLRATVDGKSVTRKGNLTLMR